jgi:hypothetical protein
MLINDSLIIAFIVILVCHWYLLKGKQRTPIKEMIAWILNIASILWIFVVAYFIH